MLYERADYTKDLIESLQRTGLRVSPLLLYNALKRLTPDERAFAVLQREDGSNVILAEPWSKRNEHVPRRIQKISAYTRDGVLIRGDPAAHGTSRLAVTCAARRACAPSRRGFCCTSSFAPHWTYETRSIRY